MRGWFSCVCSFFSQWRNNPVTFFPFGASQYLPRESNLEEVILNTSNIEQYALRHYYPPKSLRHSCLMLGAHITANGITENDRFRWLEPGTGITHSCRRTLIPLSYPCQFHSRLKFKYEDTRFLCIILVFTKTYAISTNVVNASLWK